MKKNALLKHLREHGCELLREGSRHSWWHNPALNKRSSIPRHMEIIDTLAKKICKDLGVPLIKLLEMLVRGALTPNHISCGVRVPRNNSDKIAELARRPRAPDTTF